MSRPYAFALLLAVSTLVGLVGMFVLDGASDFAFLLLAALPVLLGTRAVIGKRSRSSLRIYDRF
ncbi:MAG: hypothetical protein K2X73_15255 [Sphingomonas sp.]|jgi:hypothetical protein|uniref:hypothetical protein n=1 Tax=Sphingomonas sp. TaxID=28214 RepID=UPI0025D03C6F|nr:hypothetical protein [Sphingomonas sp.]MBX9883308.1 hypothetical protein [Sphingomonas sp.]